MGKLKKININVKKENIDKINELLKDIKISFLFDYLLERQLNEIVENPGGLLWTTKKFTRIYF